MHTKTPAATKHAVRYYVATSTEEVVGPYTERMVQAMLDDGQIGPDTLVCCEGGEEWKPLRSAVKTGSDGIRRHARTAMIVGGTTILLTGLISIFLSHNTRRHDGVLARATQKVSADESAFLREGIALQEHCRQGVAFNRFAEQLVNVKTAFRLAEEDLRGGEPMRHLAFQNAISTWDLALSLWNRQVKGRKELHPSWELDEINSILEQLGKPRLNKGEETPKEISFRDDPASPKTVSLARLVSIALAKGDGDFDYAVDFKDVKTAVERINALESQADGTGFSR